MSNDRKGGNGKKPNSGKKKAGTNKTNVVQFPGPGRGGNRKPAAQSAGELEGPLQQDLPEFVDFFVPRALEYASLTAMETADLLDELLEGEDEELEASDLMALEVLNVVLVKLRGMALVLPPAEILTMLLPDYEVDDDYMEIHEMVEGSADMIQDILVEMIDLPTTPGAASMPTQLTPNTDILDEPRVQDTLDEVCETIEEVVDILEDLLTEYYEDM